MAIVDLKDNVVVVRIVYDGPAYAGKTTTVRALARGFSRTVDTPLQADGRTLFFDWLEYTGGLFEGRQIRCQIVSVPGQAELFARRRALLESADVVVFVVDTGDADAVERSIVAIRELKEILRQAGGTPIGIIVQANKRDLPGAVSREGLRAALGEDFEGIALTESVAEEGLGVRETFVLAVRVALDRVRGDVTELAVGECVGEEQLLAALQALPITAAQGPYAREVPVVADDAPRLPDANVPSGAIWPPLEGRLVLHEAMADSHVVVKVEDTGAWTAGEGTPWRIHSAASAEYGDLDVARAALLNQARAHANHGELLSPSRCVVLAESRPGAWRVWQIAKVAPSLRVSLADVQHLELEPLYQRLAATAATLSEAYERWTGTPLKPTLDSVGRRGSWLQYVELLPWQGVVRAALSSSEREARIAAQLTELFRVELRARRLEITRSFVTMWQGVAPWDGVIATALAASLHDVPR
ncbi:MAG: GTPase domain-containing protein [Kofleriaceae bacterium]